VPQNIYQPQKNIFDLCIIGGGINGTGIACDAAGRGLSVLLCEQGDLASATSSSSTKLIHGGLRYLEHYEFKLVHEALKEREILLKKAPHLIWPLNFVMPHNKRLRPLWLIRMGLFLYDHLSRRNRLPASHLINLDEGVEGYALQTKFRKGFMYSDCWVDDARLVILNAMAARENGATILPRTKCISVKRENDHWEVHLIDVITQKERTIIARMLVDAAGPWVDRVMKKIIHQNSPSKLKLVKGSHIVVPKLFEGEHAYLLQNPDKRVIFAIPYEHQFTLIGTTEVDFSGDPSTASIDEGEKKYLCESINRYFKQSISPDNIVWSYSGVRPLQDNAKCDASSTTRDYQLKIDTEKNQAPLLTVFGGKITTFRTLSEHALEKIKPFFDSCGDAWTKNSPLPGGDFKHGSFKEFLLKIGHLYPWLPEKTRQRLAHQYGTNMHAILAEAHGITGLGEDFGHGLYAREVEYLMENEWAENIDDILWRRTKLGLFFLESEKEKLKNWITEKSKNWREIQS